MDSQTERAFANFPAVLLSGNADSIRFSVSSVLTSDGSSIEFPAPGVVAIVGANNMGKSTFLRELRDCLSQHLDTPTYPKHIVQGVNPLTVGSPADLLAWLEKHARLGEGNEGFYFAPLGGGQNLTASWLRGNFTMWWESWAPQGSLGPQLAPFLVHFADTQSRLKQSEAAPVREDIRHAPSHPIHILSDDPDRLKKINLLSERIFAEPLVLDRLSARMRLKVGKLSAPPPSYDSIPKDWQEALQALPDLAEQGDGMRSLLGLLLPIVGRSYPVVIVDEPEAFLHPPQATALGRSLGEIVIENSQQLILATHDRNLLAGLLESEVPLSVVRVDRNQSPLAKQLTADRLKEVWKQPALRYSNVLDGLFHRLVVLVEADADGRFYSAALDILFLEGKTTVPSSDVLFVPCGGISGMARMAEALTEIGVPVIASPDLDVLREKAELRKLVKALGGIWNGDLEKNYKLAVSVIDTRSTILVKDVLPLIEDIFGADGTKKITSEMKRNIDRILSPTSAGWDEVKRNGTTAFGYGVPGQAAKQLVDGLRERHVVAVRVGQLEGFAPGLGVAKGPKWLPAALEAGCHRRPEVAEHVALLMEAGLGITTGASSVVGDVSPQ